jgi:hypothetical protein
MYFLYFLVLTVFIGLTSVSQQMVCRLLLCLEYIISNIFCAGKRFVNRLLVIIKHAAVYAGPWIRKD